MSFKEQLAKHENILNRFKALYINNENQNKNSINDKSSNIEMNNSENPVTEQDIVNILIQIQIIITFLMVILLMEE